MTEKTANELLTTCSKLAATVERLAARVAELERENAELKRENEFLKKTQQTVPSYPTPPDYSPVIPLMPPRYYPPINPSPVNPYGPSDWPPGPTITCSVNPCEKHTGRVRIKSKSEA